MIVVPTVGKYDRDEYVICPRSPITVPELREDMIRRAKVAEGSYAYRLVEDLHSAIFIQSLDLKADYKAYFACEYKSFGDYIRRRVRFRSATAAALIKAAEVSSGLYHFRPWYSFLTDSYGADFLARLLEDSPPGEAS